MDGAAAEQALTDSYVEAWDPAPADSGSRASESIEDLIANVESLLARMGQPVDPDLARLSSAVYADVDEVCARAGTRRRRHSGLRAGLTVAMVAAVAMTVCAVCLAARRGRA